MKLTLEDIKKAEAVIRPHIFRTPIEYSDHCSKRAGCEVFLKFEQHQKTGSFKIRGAANKISSLNDQEMKAGVVASSAGNHAQGVACIAEKLGIQATIIMPEQSPLIKVLSTKRFGANIILHGNNYDEAYHHALEIRDKTGATFIHPFQDEKIMAGQGTIGLEIHSEMPDLDAVFISIGGGGLLSGVATALKTLNPNIKIIGVQAEGASSMARSFKAGKIDTNVLPVSTIADGIAVKKPSPEIYEHFISKLCDDVVTVSEAEIADGIVFLMERAKTVVEGAGVASVAALINKKSKLQYKKALAILSGGNIDLNILGRIIDHGLQFSGRLARISISAPDIPGTMQGITSMIASEKANILQITHNRVSERLHLRETIIEFTLETTGVEQVEKIKNNLKNLGCKLIE